jgi:hypothetical protein
MLFTDSPSGAQYRYTNGVWMQVSAAQIKLNTARNRIVNGAMMVSQENGDAASAVGSTGAYYPADQWAATWGLGTGTASAARIRPSDTGSDGASITVGTALAAPAAGAYCQIGQKIEGTRVRDFQWGTASPKQAVLRFKAYSNYVGTYSVQIKNSAADRTFLAPFTLPANAWTGFTIVVPGDTTGTWLTDTGTGIDVGFGLVAGSTYGGGVAGWQAGNKVQMAGASNLAATAGAVFFLSDVGWYLDAQQTGAAPPWEAPDYASELAACQRYWETGQTLVHNTIVATGYFKVTKRANPAMGGGAGIVTGVGSTVDSFTYQGAATNSFIWQANARM